ncbi:hypothetical protein OF385_11185 [Glutamicibacter sp. JL.03c]|uniref:hypothetical protein n=1 Tax=Glutamicibacter sp. JL.03c TaxID=2984842 RepID=UPI0021F737A5|nr:hypothetical protein [Glutamicibacter sp. JL.03c]UYQ76595.1 hypothetical protein OF385_11185 [Glutamicibacter sp. JL.03c]
MTGLIVVLVLLIVGAYFFGRSRGLNQPRQLSEPSPERLREAWQEGYEAATAYLRRTGVQPPAQAPPADERSPAPSQTPLTPKPPASGPQQGAGYGAPAQTAHPLPPVARPVAPPKPVKVLTKRERELRNINITLYVAALMIVAAGALFLSFALPPVAKVIAFIILAAAFYAGGLITCAVKPTLRPAGAAFAGTGLALLPLCAIATYNTLDISGPVTWLVFSVIGTLAVGYATVRLKSRVLSWVAVLILVSTGMASAATMQRGILNYMLILVALSILLMLLAVRSQRVQESIFFQAILGTAQLLPIFVVALTGLLIESLGSREFFWIFALLTAQLLMSMRLLSNLRLTRFFAARVAFMLMLLAGCNYLGFVGSTIALVLAYAFALQAGAVLVYSTAYQLRLGLDRQHVTLERCVLWGLGLVSMSGAYLLADERHSFVLSYVAAPLFALLCLFGIFRATRAETAVIALLPLIALLDLQHHSWRPLAVVAVAIAGLTIAHQRASGLNRLVYGHVRWGLLLVGAGVVGAAIHESFDGFPGRAAASATLITVLLMALALWALSLRRQKLNVTGMAQAHALGRLGASGLISVCSLCYLRILAGSGHYLQSPFDFMGLHALTWFMITTVATTALVIATAMRVKGLPVMPELAAQSLKGGETGALLLLYVLSFEQRHWIFALVIGSAVTASFLLNLRRDNSREWKIGYATLAQALFSSMVWWFAQNMDFDLHGRFALLLVSVSIPQLVRLARNIRNDNPLRKELRWIAIVMLIGFPVATAAYATIADGYDRGVVLLAALCFAVHGIMAYRADVELEGVKRQYYLFAPILSLILVIGVQAQQLADDSGWIRSRWWSEEAAAVLLLVMVLAAMALEWKWRGKRNCSTATGLAIFLPAVVAAAWQQESWWAVISLALIAAAMIMMVHTRRSAWYSAGASMLLAGAITWAVMKARDAGGSRLLESMDVAWAMIGTGVLLYLISMLHGRMRDSTPGYPAVAYRHEDPIGGASRIYFAVMLLAFLLAGCIAHSYGTANWNIIGGSALIFGVALLYRYFELPTAAVPYAVDGLIFLASVLSLTTYAKVIDAPQFSSMMAYFTVVAVILVIWRTIRVDRSLAKIYLMAASVAGTMTLFASLIDSNVITQVMGLVFFGCLIAWGLKLGERLFIWWGAIAISLSVIWFLRELVFLWLVLIGLGLIIAAVYKLVKVDKAGPSAPEPQGYEQPVIQQGPARLPWQQPMQPPEQQPDQWPPAEPREPDQR